MEQRKVSLHRAEGSDTIDNMIKWLQDAKDKGATHYKMWWSQDPDWAFKWIEAYRNLSDEELKQEKINKLQ